MLSMNIVFVQFIILSFMLSHISLSVFKKSISQLQEHLYIQDNSITGKAHSKTIEKESKPEILEQFEIEDIVDIVAENESDKSETGLYGNI